MLLKIKVNMYKTIPVTEYIVKIYYEMWVSHLERRTEGKGFETKALRKIFRAERD